MVVAVAASFGAALFARDQPCTLEEKVVVVVAAAAVVVVVVVVRRRPFWGRKIQKKIKPPF